MHMQTVVCRVLRHMQVNTGIVVSIHGPVHSPDVTLLVHCIM